MKSVASVVEDIIEDRPIIEEALGKGIINNAALSEQLKPEIEKILKKKVKFSAVNMAIRRLSEKLEKKAPEKIKFDKSCDITIKSDLVGITVHKIKDFQGYIAEIYKAIDYRSFITITQGQNEIMILTSEKYLGKINEILPKSAVKKTIRNLCSLSINIPATSTKTLGLFYITTRALTWNNICIVDIVSTLTEMTFIVNEEDTSRAFDTLRGVIRNST